MNDHHRSETEPRPDESDHQRLDRELIEFLNESRLVLPGVQVLFAFLLTLPFTGRFAGMDSYERLSYSVAFFSTALASVLMITPSSFHRLRFRKGDKEAIIRASNRLILAAIACLAVAIVSVIWLVAELLYSVKLANLIGVIAAVVVVGLWFVLPVSRRFLRGR